MNSLHTLINQGKVLYLVSRFTYASVHRTGRNDIVQGISDAPAWVVTKANTYARDHGKTPFVIYQGLWSILKRDFERDIIPMAVDQGMALAPWGVLGGGRIRTDAEEQRRRETGEKGTRHGSSPLWVC